MTPCAPDPEIVKCIRSGKDGVYFNNDHSYTFIPSDGSNLRYFQKLQDASLCDFAVDGPAIFQVGEQGVWAITPQ
jgi:hypothetical protein